jgi:hypothetical protein
MKIIVFLSALAISALTTSPFHFDVSTNHFNTTHEVASLVKGPCDCEKGWNFTVHQITPQGCREKNIYCVEGVKLEPGYSCGPCPKPCSTCPVDDEGRITLCHVPIIKDNFLTHRAECKDLQRFFKEDGSFVNSKDHCGPCSCVDANDKDTDGDGVCDRKDGCPNNPDKQKPGFCGCEDQDSDGDGVCDQEDRCAGSDDRKDSDKDGIPDGCEPCDISGNNTFEWIDEVKINSFNKKSGPDSKGYADFSKSAVSVVKGEKLSIWITAGYADAVCELSHAIFVDWNQDNDFEDAGELIFSERTIGETGIDFIIPESVRPGKYTVRVLVDLGRIYASCGGCIDGEAEDYIIEIVESTCIEVHEGFDYNLDSQLKSQNGGQEWQSGWNVSTSGASEAVILQNSLYQFPFATTGQKLAVLNNTGSNLNISRQLSQSIIQGNHEVWLSFLYSYKTENGAAFQTLLNNSTLGFKLEKNGALEIGGLKAAVLEKDKIHQFVIKAILNQGDDHIEIWINPSPDFNQYQYNVEYDVPIDGNASEVTFAFGSAGIINDQYLDEIRIGCSREDVIKIQGATATESRSTFKQTELNIYPNPYLPGSELQIEVKNATSLFQKLAIYDTKGQLIQTNSVFAGSNLLKVDHLEAGMYFIEARSELNKVQSQLIIQK